MLLLKGIYVAIYAVGPKPKDKNMNKWPIRFGVSKDPKTVFFAVGQRWHWEELQVFALYCTAGLPEARKVLAFLLNTHEEKLKAGESQAFLGDWYEITMSPHHA